MLQGLTCLFSACLEESTCKEALPVTATLTPMIVHSFRAPLSPTHNTLTTLAPQLVDLCKTYFGGKLSENSVRNNFVLM